MGYTTSFLGSIAVSPPLSDQEADYLRAFADTRRMARGKGPYHVDRPEDKSNDIFGPKPVDVTDYNKPPECQPGLWCQWVPNADGSAIEWDGGEKFYSAPEWMSYLRSHFVSLNAAKAFEPRAHGFWSAHRMDGVILAVGEESREDVWQLKVDDDGVFTRRGSWSEKALSELFGDTPEKEEGGEEDEDYEDYEPPYVSDEEALQHCSENPDSVVWPEEWERVPDFAEVGMADRLAALKDKDVLEDAVSKRPRRVPGIVPRAL